MSILTDIKNLFTESLPQLLESGPQAANDLTQGKAYHPPPGPLSNIPKDISTIGSSITSVSDFLSYIAWIFYPANLLRAVEFVLGIVLILFGLTKFRGIGGFGRAAISATPVGRIIRVRQGTRMGRYEGQREAARMRARQAETRGARQESAYEREVTARDARRRARS